MVTYSREVIVAELVEAGARRDQACLYADLFIEYRDASANIAENGTIVIHPTTGNPIANPYVPIRDKALKQLQGWRGFNPSFLWE